MTLHGNRYFPVAQVSLFSFSLNCSSLGRRTWYDLGREGGRVFHKVELISDRIPPMEHDLGTLKFGSLCYDLRCF